MGKIFKSVKGISLVELVVIIAIIVIISTALVIAFVTFGQELLPWEFLE